MDRDKKQSMILCIVLSVVHHTEQEETRISRKSKKIPRIPARARSRRPIARARMQRCRDVEMQRCSDVEMQRCSDVCRNVEMQRCMQRCSDVKKKCHVGVAKKQRILLIRNYYAAKRNKMGYDATIVPLQREDEDEGEGWTMMIDGERLLSREAKAGGKSNSIRRQYLWSISCYPEQNNSCKDMGTM